MSKIDNIWSDDLLGRKPEALMIADYVASASDRLTTAKSNFSTLAIDAHYGEGKTFFLNRLTSHLALKHPVAFVDAWADDLVDDPLTALTTTIEDALSDLLPQSTAIDKRWKDAKQKAGKIAVIAGKGLLKRGAGLIFTAGAVEATADILSSFGDDLSKAIQDDVTDAADAARDKLFSTSNAAATGMDHRIATFKLGRKAIADFKDSMTKLVEAVSKSEKSLPIVVIIDELDRCRPTYAIKLLEEVKHLLDIPGLFFILGLHNDQLARAVNGVYGESFDGPSYLKRFINRTYTLAEPPLERLVETLLQSAGVEPSRLAFPQVRLGEEMPEFWTPAKLIAQYLRNFDFRARDAHLVVDMIQTCASLTGQSPLYMPLLLPLILLEIESNISLDEALPKIGQKPTFAYHDQYGRLDQESPRALFKGIFDRLNWSLVQLQRERDHHSEILCNLRRAAPENVRYADPTRYKELVRAIGRFSQPSEPDRDLSTLEA